MTGTLTTSSTPRGCSQNAGVHLAVHGERRVVGAGGRARRGFAGERELLAAPSGDHQQIGAGLLLVVGGDRHQRRPVADVDHGLELRQVGDQPRGARDVVELRAPLLVDERGGFGQVALQLGFGLAWSCAR